MSKEPVNVAIVGAGYISDYHLDALRARPGIHVAAVCDLNLGRAQRWAQGRGIPSAYGDLGQMLAQEQLHAVHVLTPPNAHIAPGVQVLEAGVDALLEKPLAHTTEGCQQLRKAAAGAGRALGVSHNFLFTDAYERLVEDVRSGRLGTIDQVDIVWNKELGQLKGGPWGAWMLAHPRNILFEVAPHSFAHAGHLVGELDDVSVDARDQVTLPRGLRFFRRWEIRGWRGNTSVRMRLCFIDGFSEHYIHVRGTQGTAHVDFENSTYVRQEHTPQLLDIDRYLNVTNAAKDQLVQATGTLANFVLGKAGVVKIAQPFGVSIANAVRAFYDTREGVLDERLGGELAEGAIALAERVAAAAELPEPKRPPRPTIVDTKPPSTVLVIGGTGFIGKVLVKHLRKAGKGVRLLARDPYGVAPELMALGLDVVKGDFTDLASIRPALEGITHVYHLARGFGKTWPEYLKYDVEPTRKLAEACLEAGVERFIYSSSIAIYYAGKKGEVITEDTQPVESMLRANPYARSKVENERNLLALHRDKGLPVVLNRPGIVLGAGGNPYHWGIAEWPYTSVCRLYGDGNNPLPIVLVEDTAAAMVKMLDAPGAVGQSYNLTAEPCITANEYLDELERRAGIKLRRVPMPAVRSYVEAMGKWAVKAVGKDPAATMPSFADWQGRSFAARFDASKASKELGWTPVSDRQTIIADGIHGPADEFIT
ncbi:MAG: NAD-dependent epimerase/dehydratase family protein [Myxococcales bacterium]|nr:NAD-dependent epimerase/dehydratase family protein [Myxococcales bacterium]